MASSTRLSYPRDRVYDEYADYVEIQFFKYRPPFDQDYAGEGKVSGATFLNEGSDNSSKGLSLYNSSSTELEPISVGGYEKILMYMPEDIQAQYSTDWGDKGFTNFGSDMLRAATDTRTGEGTLGAVLDGISKAAGRGPSLIAQELANRINQLPGGIGGNVTIQDVLSGTSGVILNPNVEMMFQGFGLRSFTLNFKMVPRNREEALDIRNIITCFKKSMLPTYGAEPELFSKSENLISKQGSVFTSADLAGDNESKKYESNNSNYIGVPNLCGITFKRGGKAHPFLPLYKGCVITGLNVNYTPDGAYSTYFDGSNEGDATGSPVATSISIDFAETKLVYSNEITFGGASY